VKGVTADGAVRNPFPGLRPFRPDEEHLFFGREKQVDRMIDKLAVNRFLAVVGTSGSGKSSLVNCGLRPALHRGNMSSAGASWRMVQFRPGGGSDPIGALAKALAEPDVLFDRWDDDGLTVQELVEITLRLGSLGLVDIVAQARLPEGMQLLVVVDQFEELFRFRAAPARVAETAYGPRQDAISFVKLLLEAREQTRVPIHILLTMRSDFLGDCAQFLGLAEAINEGQYLVPRLTRDEIRDAILGPVAVGEAAITPVLVTRLLNDVGDNPDQLSILQHALNRTWANWANEGGAQGPLDLPHYEAVGGMADALNRHADRAFDELGGDVRKRVAERVFKALTDKGSDPRGIRRPTRLKDLGAICDATPAELEPGLEVFRRASRSFLMPPAGESLTPDSWIDISHESLMRLWKRLDRWADEEAQSARTYCRLAETAAEHAAGNASLWRGPELQRALDWREKIQPNEAWALRCHPGFPFAAAMDFLTRSSEARDAERAERERTHQREIEAEQEKAAAQAKYAQRMRWAALISTSTLALLVVGLFGWWNESYVRETWVWYTKMRHYMVAQIRPYVLSGEREQALKPGDSFRECAATTDCPKMIIIPAGEFTMGSPGTEQGRFDNEGPQHKVTIAKRFAVSKFDVTFADWDACFAVGGCPQVSDSGFGRGTRPVINVSWDGARKYVAWLSKMTGQPYRLLTEAEWEYAARAGTTTAYYWGDEIGRGNADCYGCASDWDRKQTAPVGSFAANAFLLHDMAGNVFQWVQDCYHDDYNGAPADGSPWTTDDCSHVIRGGSWFYDPPNLRSAYRIKNAADYQNDTLGFRVARTLTP
jgi:formylglycine-generating enzyme required for sulfatase activity